MGSLKEKLKSQRGASFLLALLFLLICMMVSASILMASVSNAGKHRSNLEEHQTYLALSSAVSALCDELNRTEYRGQYQYWETQQTVVDPNDGKETIITLRHFTQQDGVYHHTEGTEPGYLKSVLLSDLDAIFAHEIQSTLDSSDFETFRLKPGTVQSHTLTVTPQTGTELDGREVKVKLSVEERSYIIDLTATLDDDYQIRAELTPATSRPTLPVMLTQGQHTTESLQWSIGWITTGN